MAGRGAGGFFAGLKNKLSDTFKELSSASSGGPGGGGDAPYERKLAERVDAATSDLLSAPDYGMTFELVDTINNDPQGASDKVYRALRRRLLAGPLQTQLLALSLLEACVRNCVPFFFEQLVYSDLWAELLRAAEPTRGWDAEVRDRALGLVEDFGRGLPLPAYREAYEGLLDRGVDFPVRPDAATADGAAAAPYYTPPPVPAQQQAAAAALSPEDRAAIASAVADLEHQAAQRAADEAARAPPGMPAAGHVPALMGPALLMGAPIRPPGYHAPPGYAPVAQQAAHQPPAMVAGAPPAPGAAAGAADNGAIAGGASAAAGLAHDKEAVEQTLRVSRNSAELLTEMLAPLKAAPGQPVTGEQEQLLGDLVGQCQRYKATLADLIPRLGDQEELISAALAANDDLGRALHEHEQLLLAARGGGGVASGGAGAGAGAGGGGGGGVGASSSGGAAAAFVLDDDDAAEQSLQTSRAGGGGGAGPSSSRAGGGDLISLDGASGGGAQPGAATEQRLVDDMDKLLLGAQPPK